MHASILAAPPDEDMPPRPKGDGIITRYCAFHNDSQTTPECSPSNNSTCVSAPPEREECSPTEPDKSNYCFILWHFDNNTGEATVRFKGCFLDTVSCYTRSSSCRVHNTKLPLLNCCCEGDMCNANMTFPGLEAGIPPSTEIPPKRVLASSPLPEDDTKAIIAYTLIPLFILFAALVGCYFLYRRRKGGSFAELGSVEASLSRPPSTGAGMDNEIAGIGGQVTLCEVRARGRFGAVWRAKLGQKDVAVKVFPLQDKQSWLAEQEIYKLPRMDHPDILHFIGVDKRGDNLQAEYWLITAYHEKVIYEYYAVQPATPVTVSAFYQLDNRTACSCT